MTSDRAPKCGVDTFLNKKGKKCHFGDPFVAISCGGLKSSLLSSFHGYLHHLLHPTLSTMYEISSSILLMKFSPLSLLLLYVCVWSFFFLLVWWSIFFLNPCGFKSKLPHSLFQAHKEFGRVSSTYGILFILVMVWSMWLPYHIKRLQHKQFLL